MPNSPINLLQRKQAESTPIIPLAASIPLCPQEIKETKWLSKHTSQGFMWLAVSVLRVLNPKFCTVLMSQFNLTRHLDIHQWLNLCHTNTVHCITVRTNSRLCWKLQYPLIAPYSRRLWWTPPKSLYQPKKKIRQETVVPMPCNSHSLGVVFGGWGSGGHSPYPLRVPPMIYASPLPRFPPPRASQLYSDHAITMSIKYSSSWFSVKGAFLLIRDGNFR